MSIPQEFLNALVSAHRARTGGIDYLFDWLIGSWDIEAVLHDADGRTHPG